MAEQFDINFNGDEADSWIKELEALNKETDELLNNTNSTLKEIADSGTGTIIETFIDVGVGVVDGFTILIDTNRSLAEKFKDIQGSFADTAKKVTQDIKRVAEKAFAAGSKSFTTRSYDN